MTDTTASIKANTSIFVVGGTVQAGEGLYIRRQADAELFDLCRQGAFAYVLTPRQLGKSSLMVDTAQRLEAEGIRTVIVDLTQIGVNVSAEQWYLGLLTVIEDSFELRTNAAVWWQQYTQLGMTQRLTVFFEKVMLAEVEEPVVIFIDEIDTTLTIPYADDFFAAVRYIHNARAVTPVFKRLSFVLIGVATPSDLISDPKRTPFNIGRQVDLTDFTEQEAAPLAQGFGLDYDEARQVLRGVLQWTNGHPYLTQRLCRAIAEEQRTTWTEKEIDKVVEMTFFGERSREDHNLQFVRDMLTKRASDKQAVLAVYENVRRGRPRVPDEARSQVKTHLKLSGVVRRLDGALVVRNRIYATVFDLKWVRTHWPRSWIQRHATAIIRVGTVLVFVLAVVSTFLAFATNEERKKTVQALEFAEERANEAKEQEKIAVENAQDSQQQEQIAFDARDEARREREAAQISAQDARQQGQNAIIARADADRQREAAEENEAEAEQERQNAIDARDEADRQSDAAQKNQAMAESEREAATRARKQTLGLALAGEAVTELERGDAQLGALLARQAYVFNQESENVYANEIYNALRRTLNALQAGAGGPTIDTTLSDWVTALDEKGRWFPRDGAYQLIDTLLVSNGALQATGYADGVVRLYNSKAGGPEAELRGHQGPITALAFSPDGALLASGSGDRTIRLWQLKPLSNKPVVLEGHTDWVLALVFGSDSETLISGSADRTIRRWSINAERLAQEVCNRVTRWLKEEEWGRFVGPDIPYEEYVRCSQGTP